MLRAEVIISVACRAPESTYILVRRLHIAFRPQSSRSLHSLHRLLAVGVHVALGPDIRACVHPKTCPETSQTMPSSCASNAAAQNQRWRATCLWGSDQVSKWTSTSSV